eukprot:gnl/TRDRNA2_/TRDRNA2_175057_c0_seq5.p1 gnl/TRDRNA2_/TRDRNA2_175057_c0~~gnl/TRDRNA2_/TRDRNA2_175057_c0_seq5.p1  ORF type:complete len:174 (+),score=24.22 gnl/TRDRNA2_/TRDRNA2_175057_c0_seq5:69-590(+)
MASDQSCKIATLISFLIGFGCAIWLHTGGQQYEPMVAMTGMQPQMRPVMQSSRSMLPARAWQSRQPAASEMPADFDAQMQRRQALFAAATALIFAESSQPAFASKIKLPGQVAGFRPQGKPPASGGPKSTRKARAKPAEGLRGVNSANPEKEPDPSKFVKGVDSGVKTIAASE